jgi:hypothetical protein
MKQLPPNFPVGRLVGSTLAEICFSESSTSLTFDNGDVITSYVEDVKLVESFQGQNVRLKLLSSIGSKVTTALTSNSRDMILVLGNSTKITFCAADDSDYSYSAYVDGIDYFL